MCSGKAFDVLRWLVDHGKPATAVQIAEATGINQTTVNSVLVRNSSLFVAKVTPGVKTKHVWVAWEE